MINNQYLLHNKVKNKYIKNILNQMIHISEENIGWKEKKSLKKRKKVAKIQN